MFASFAAFNYVIYVFQSGFRDSTRSKIRGWVSKSCVSERSFFQTIENQPRNRDQRGYVSFGIMLNLPGRVVKRTMDLGLSTLLILGVLSWLLPLLALLVKLDSPGPVFFVQKRRKKGTGWFFCIKLRTMYVNADADRRIAVQRDPRVTSIGRWLRCTHLDELPQLFNVWWGDMSLVGPRPYMLQEDQLYRQVLTGYAGRTRVKPGITGLAQAAGFFGGTSNVAEMQKRLSLDLAYVEEWSPALDLRIMASTIRYLKPTAHDA